MRLARGMGLGGQDSSAVVRVYEENLGRSLRTTDASRTTVSGKTRISDAAVDGTGTAAGRGRAAARQGRRVAVFRPCSTEEARVGNDGGRTGRSGWGDQYKKK